MRAALPGISVWVDKSVTRAGRSNYVFIDMPRRTEKVRISDHPVGMTRALWGGESLFVSAGATIDSWSVWLSRLAKEMPLSNRALVLNA
ncbi:MAG: hypothetical protein WDM94_09290 [Bauldia sp.]